MPKLLLTYGIMGHIGYKMFTRTMTIDQLHPTMPTSSIGCPYIALALTCMERNWSYFLSTLSTRSIYATNCEKVPATIFPTQHNCHKKQRTFESFNSRFACTCHGTSRHLYWMLSPWNSSLSISKICRKLYFYTFLAKFTPFLPVRF